LQTSDATSRYAPQHPSAGRLTPRTYKGPLCLHELIEEQAGRTPDRIAVSFEDTSLTYRELLDRAGCLARHLVGMGVGPDVRVGVCAERSLEMVVGLLGVLRAGGAYVPLDPSYPAERLAFMVGDAAAPVVLTQRRLAGLLPPHGAQTVLLDDPEAWNSQAVLLPEVPPDALAYVIYTSGSTGRPKGAMNAHRAVRNRLLWMRDDFGLGPDEVVLQKTPFSFDISVWEIFATLIAGGRLVMARPGGHVDSAYLVEVMEREGITLAHFVPSMLRAFLSAPGLGRCTALRRVLCSGEAVSEDLERRFFERFGADGPELHNLYGPTEAAVEVTWWQCGAGRSGPVPIGRPLPNTEIHLVGPEMEPVEEGELLIGGIQPARGYHGRPDLTAERFIPDPFGEPGSRLYRTGDLARFRTNGVVDFLGRLDFQVKIRGFRIELGEVESGLGSHPAVHEAVVTAREQRLVAYVVVRAAVDKEALRAHLALRLPDYMVPADWVFLEAFPLTPSGKIDRKALPDPERVRVEHVPPGTPLERFLAALWEETLAVERVGLRDSIFDLGGTSITGAVVINRLQGVMAEILHVVALFDAPTLAELAAYLGREHRVAVARVWGEGSLPEDLTETAGPARVDEARLADLRALVQPLAPFPSAGPKNPPVLFVLAPPRSGTTLLRVMLGGHPGLFSPPELELLTFNTMDERRAAFSGRDSFWREGVLRAVMEARGCPLDEARDLVEACEREGWTTRRFYRQLQDWVGGRTLVDKSTNYPLDPEVLKRAEETFDSPFYLHLVRHPYGMIHSFEEAKIDQVFFRRPHPFARRELAELIWTVSQRNILAFLETVPAHRQHRLLFENLVRDPEGELRRLCAALGIEYHPDMADPYKEKQARMTDGLHAEGRMLGDMKFHEHQGVDAGTAERWRQDYAEDFLGEPAWTTAVALGYPRQAPDAIVPAPRSRPLPLSPAQERLWFLDRLMPGSPLYNSCREIRLRGPLDMPALAAALDGIVRRHEALRTVFDEVEDGPVQIVLPAMPSLQIPLPMVDLSGLSGPVRRAEARRLALETARRPFDLRHGPLLRAALLRLKAEEHALRLDIHHIATDGWSMVLLQRELEALYRFELPPILPVQYADYAVWQRRWLEREGSAQLEAWRIRLEGLPPALELPADRPRPAVQGLDGALERMALPAELAGRLEEVGRGGAATLFMVLLAAFQAWLHRITGREDLAVGVPSANRGRPEIERLIGFFVNNLVIRADLSGDPSFAEALGRVREAALFAYAHPDLPFEKLVAELAPDRDLSRPPIYQVAFSLQDPPPALDFGGGLRGEMSDVHTGTAKFDLWLQVDREDLGWSLRAEYPTALFDAATVRRWLGHLRVLLEGIAAHPRSRLSDLPLLTPEECEQLVVWNRTAAEVPALPVHELFMKRARMEPEAVAVSWSGGSLTYGELLRRSLRLAGWLRNLGLGPENLVALSLERSPELVTASVGVLLAGAAYLPTDPSNPPERLARVLSDSGASLLLTAELLEGLGLDEIELPDEPLPRPDLDRLAYVIYTSGSTGQPKGIDIAHRGLSNTIAHYRRRYPLGFGDRAALLASPAFDASLFEMWGALISGASLHVVPAEILASPWELLDWYAREKIVYSFLPPALLEPILAESVTRLPPGLALRWAMAGGDRLRLRPAPGWPFAVANNYGPTEASIASTEITVTPEGDRPPSIGRPLANVRVYILDAGLQPVPVGAAGELCIAGIGVGRGYRGRPDLTAERFIPDPFGPPGSRIYRTSDLARWLPSGEVDFIGRLDHQVKIRGYRIELGEIEALLGLHPAVREAAVLEQAGRLVAFVVGPVDRQSGDLRSFLAGRLPDYMVPTGWVFLESLPLSSSGKVDRRALAGLAPVWAVESAEPPLAGVETELAAVWTDLFGVSVSRQDDFFTLGGHSLLAARLAFRVRERLGVDLPLRAVFEAPTLAALADVAARIREEGRATDDLPLVAGAPRPAPASFAQQRLWFLDRLQPGSPAFNMPFVLRFAGPLCPGALGASLGEVVRRHETLRTTLALLPGEIEPVQIVAAPSVSLPVVDLACLPAGLGEIEAGRLAASEARRPFDLEAGPLLRSTLLRLSGEDHRLLLTMHHAVSDGWSMGVLLRELREAYRGLPLAPLPVQYSDFAVWQRQWLSGDRLEAQLAFWLERLAAREGAAELPSDRPRPAVASLRGGRESLPLPEGLLDAVERAGRRHGATAFVTLLAAFQALVYRITGHEDLVVGSPVAGRRRPEVEGLIGLFVNLLPLRVRLDGELSLAALLERTRETAVSALEHQDVPFERLVAELEPDRDLSRHSVFQVVLVVEDAPAAAGEIAPGLVLSPIQEVPTGTAKLDLTLALTGTTLEARYAADLFDAATMRRLLGHYCNLLQGFAAEGSSEVRVADLPLLDAAEREQVLVAWNRTGQEIPDEPVHRQFFQWAERTPHAPAVVWEGGSLTYAELAGRVEGLAERLREQGVGPEAVVALCLERSPELVTAALAVLEAGGAYLPIDPAHPEERRTWIVEDSGAAVVVRKGHTDNHGRSRTNTDGPECPCLSVTVRVRPCAHAGVAADLAYVIYTSGSTGMPKGTELRHRGLSSLIAWHRRTYGLGPGDRSVLLAGPGFDASVWETWAPLTAGASLHIPSPDIVLSPPALLAWMADHGITVAFLPTPLAEAVLGEPLPERLALRVLLTGGDRLRRRPAPGLPFALVNHYGPTEATVVATAGRVAPEGERAPEIGGPIANTRVYLLDSGLRPVPVGVPGELCLAGEGLARGYRGRPELTAERFVPDPFAEGRRLYRTGDVARWLPSGAIEFLGRADFQVKIRGQRIELGEVEAALNRHPAVRDSVVLALDGRLVAFVVGVVGQEVGDLRSFLAGRLPDAMIPAGWVFLESLPLTPNGKVDRRALSAIELLAEESDVAAPRTPMEELLAGLFARILGLDRAAGMGESFFHLGGHSLLVAQLVSRVREVCGVEIGLRSVFEHPTVAELARVVEEGSRQTRPDEPPLVAARREGGVPLSYAQQRLWFLESLQPGTSLYNLAQAWRLSGPLSVPALSGALSDVVRRHEALRTVFSGDVEAMQIVLPPATVPVPVIDLEGLPGEVEPVLAREAGTPFDLQRGPLFRASLLRLGEEEHVLILAMHHIVSDGWSMDVLARELSALYRLAPLAPLPLQYPDFAVWQRGRPSVDRDLAWWRERLAGAPATLDLPADRPRPAVASLRGATERLHLGAEVDAAFARIGRRCGATFFMTALAAFGAFLHRLTAEEDLVVGTPVANRDRIEIEGLIGFFVNTLVLRTSLAGDPAFEELLARVRTTALEAYAHQDLPFERLVAELAPERDLSRNPLFQVSASAQEAPRPGLDLGPGVSAAMIQLRIPVAKFDLSFHLAREGEGLVASVEYASDLFDASTVDRLLGHLRTLLAGIAAAPEARVSDLPLLTAGERDQLRAAWSGGEAVPAPALTLHGLVEEQARRVPGAVALVASDGRLMTYGELMERAEALASRLRGMGVRPETRVALCAGRSPELVIGLLGILKAGGACVPVDPGHVSERLAFVLEDSGAVALATTSALSPRLPAGVPRMLLDICEEPAGSSLHPPQILPEQIAYVIYTSGSTGRPKGVAVPHGEAATHAAGVIRLFGIQPGDRVLQFASPAFDVAMEEILSTLGAGAALVLRDEMWDTETLARRVTEIGITVLNLPSAVWHHWALEAASLAPPPPLRLIVVGGEEVLAEPARQWLRSPLAGIPVLNGYGPTEAVITATLHEVTLESLGTGASVPIGRPLPGRSALVLDPRGNPAPVGVPGELYLGGCLARGYLGRAGLTAERFVPDPFGMSGARLYRSGDLVRLRPDGALEFLGRIDQQVKIRGFRVEPAEIEAVLVSHPQVAAAAVLVSGAGRGKQLVAVVEPAGAAPSPAELRTFLAERLPAWMVPAGFAVIDRLPLTRSGKVDRSALARMRFDLQRGADEAPRAGVEQALAEVWEEVLNVERVGRGEDFFHLGGHSLLAMRLASRVRARFGVELELREFFEASTLAGFAERLERALEKAPSEESEERLEQAASRAPLSSGQQRLWFLDLLHLHIGLPVYNLPVVFDVEGPLQADLLEAALTEVVRRHAALRTTFEVDPSGDPVQVVSDLAPHRLVRVDLSGLSAEEARQAADRLVAAEERRPFDLTRGPLLRSLLVRFGPDVHRLVLALHHIVADGWSVDVLLRELQALCSGSSLPELPLQYPDYAVRQRRWLAGERMSEQLAWWRQRLAGGPPALELPADRPRPVIQSLRGAEESLELDDLMAGPLEQLGRGQRATLFMTLLAAFQALLHRITGEEDVWVGTPVANRTEPGLEGLIGLFVNTLVLRTDAGGDPSFIGLIARTRETALAAFSRQELPFERLVEELAPARDLSRNPLFQVFFSVPADPPARLELAPGVNMTPRPVHTGTAKFDLSLSLRLNGEGFAAAVEYSSDLFDAATVRRLLGNLGTLLEGAVRDPEAPISALPLLTTAERAQLADWDAAAHRGHPEGDLLHGLFEAQARRTPDAPALAAGAAVLTYAELEERSARLARRLRAAGAGPEVPVAVCLERSADLVVSLLAVLRSGSFYVPLDPRYPRERLDYLLQDSGARLVVNRSFLETGDVDPEPPVPFRVEPQNLAYLIYTSGSTGRPKAVAIEHRMAVRLALWARGAFAPEELRGVIACTAVTFDLSVFEIFVPLAWGGTVILVENALAVPALAAPGALPSGVEATLVNTVPSAIGELLREGGLPGSVRTINLAGEALPRALADRGYARPQTRRLNNLYGPSEDTTYSTWTCVERASERAPSIGRPVDDTRSYVVNRRLERLPLGVPGELCLAGGGLARGYLGRPDLTAERFVPDPFSGLGARMYRTGDLARLRPDGELEYLGRLDHQVKIRGFRIELGEVEAALAREPGVEAAVVMAREDRPGDRRLAAYVMLRDGAKAWAEDLRLALRRSLPEPMVPSAFVFLDAFPLTAHGKVDRKALPRPEAREADAVFVAPRTSLEEEVAEIWKEVLGADRIGVHDNFWELGGHSLLATRVLVRLAWAFGVELPLQVLFTAPTLGELVAVLGAAVLASAGSSADEAMAELDGLSPEEIRLLLLEGRGESSAPPLVPVERGRDLPLSFAQERIWFLDRLEPGSALYNIPVVFQVLGSGLRPDALSAALAEVVRRHEVLRTVFREGARGGSPVQVVQPPGLCALPLVDLAGLPDPAAEADRLETRLARLPFDLARGPLLRAALLRTGGAEHRLFLCIHHAVFDGWSAWVLEREISAAYGACFEGACSRLPDLPVQYPDYAVWQRLCLTDELLKSELGWWRERLAGFPFILELPADRPRPARRRFRGLQHRDHVPADVTASLIAHGRSAEASLFMVLLAGYQALLARLSGSDRLLVGTPIANRRQAEVEGLIGLFVNTLALPADLSDGPSFTTHLERTRDLLLGAFGHQDLPFERLVEELTPGRDLSRTPLVQALMLLASQPGTSGALASGLTVEQRGMGTGTAKMDLSLYLRETADGGIGITWEADSDLFDAQTVARISGWLRNLLAGLAAAPERSVLEVPLLSEAERRQLESWSGVDGGPAAPTIPERVSRWVELKPDAPAVVGAGEPLSWRELGLRSSRLARRLRDLGAGPETRVAVCLQRSPDMVVAILGVLWAGAAYVVLDPDQPAGRRRRILEGSGSLVLVTAKGLAPELDGVPRVAVEQAEEGWNVLMARPEPSSLAYVIYTSGSTGEPKGVAVEHRQLACYVDAVLERLDVPPESSFATVTTFAADLGHTSVFGALASGGTLHVVPRELSADPARLAARFTGRPVDVLKIVPSHLAALLAAAPAPERVLPRRRLVVGGEASRWELIDRIRELDPGCRVLNHYGPTETTVGVLTFDLETGDGRGDRQGDNVPLGRPLRGTVVRLLDRGLQPVPVGFPAETWVGGSQVARGYLGRPDLTAERFLPDPAGESGARLYRTGDLARWLPSGDLEFLGRADDQVKVRGHRVEPGEVAAALARHPGVRQAAVLPVERAGEVRLAAYVVPEPGPDGAVPDRGALRTWLAGRLPEPMIPSELTLLDALPLTSNGKLDRWALSALGAVLSEARREGLEAAAVPELAASPAEELMAALFAELLGHERVERSQDFFEMGGHSLLAIRLLARVREAFGVELDVRSVFERRTVADLAARVEELLRGGSALPPLLPQAGEGVHPLSFAQERLWFLDRMEPGRATYNVVRELRLRGPLDPGALAEALGEVVHRHEPLRTVFEVVDGQPVQLVELFVPPPLPWIDLAGLPEDLLRAEAARLAAQEGRRPFDLRRGPMLRAALLRLASREHVLLLGVHHISFDGWSMAVLRRELGALYSASASASASGRPSRLPLPGLRYADFAVWQRQWLVGEVLEAQLTHWRERLAGSPPSLELPLDRPRPVVQSPRGGVEQVAFPRELLAALERLGRRAGATLFMTLLAGFQTLLHRITGQDDILVGAPVANRDRTEVQGLIGFFVNTLVLRADLSGDPAFAGLLSRVRETALQAYAHQDLPFERLVQELAPGRDLSRTPLFQVVFSWQPAQAGAAELAPGLGLEVAEVDSGSSKFDLSLFAGETRGGAAVAVEYAADLFDRATIQRLIGYLRNLLEGIAADGGDRVPVSSLPLMDEEEREQVVFGWNRTSAEEPEQPVHRLFEQQAAADPGALAVASGEGSLTYGELERRANRLARRLHRLGVGPEVVVAVLLERSPELMLAALAALKAGGAYLPIDPAYPAERVSYILGDAGMPVLLTTSRILAGLSVVSGQLILLDGEVAMEESEEPLHVETGPDGLAYVIYTSGSTGAPKGTELSHRGLSNLVSWHVRTYGLTAADRASLVAGPGFDASVWETWPPLTAGASLHVPPPDALPSSPSLLEWMACTGITVAFLPTPMAEGALSEPVPADLSLRVLLTGGDRLSLRPAPDLPFALVNHYGPTESTVVVTSGRVSPAGNRAPHIGGAIANVRVHVLDRGLGPVPPGVPGQLCVAGPGLARGYRGRPGLTADRFVPDPLGGSGERLYLTGDLARRLPGGEIEFLGRLDQQVKIRGYRIELGEIEAVLAAHPEVETAVVLARDEMPGDRRLVAYFVPAPEQAPDVAELRGFLALRLPSYMVPAAFVLLPGLPLTANGKVDRRALPAPELFRGAAESTPPRTPLEREVARVWREVLGVARIGVEDNFWELGGHSLLATKVLSRLCNSLGLDLPLQSLFEAPTLAGFAQSIGHHLLASSGTELELGDLLDELEGLSEVELQVLIEEETRKR
jgi:amino acid adenylation domain-containing protein